MSDARKELEQAVAKKAKELAEKDAATKKKVREMSPEEQRKALDEKIKKDSTSVQITTQG